MSKQQFILGYSPLTGSVYAGYARTNKDGIAVMTDRRRHDVTDHFWRCVVQAAQSGSTKFVVPGKEGDRVFRLVVEEVPNAD